MVSIRHFISRVAHRVKRSLIADGATMKAWMLSAAESKAEALGLRVTDVLAHRDDHKIVLLCESPEWGRCVFKVAPRYMVRGDSSHNHVATVRLARDHDTGVFPNIFHIGDHFSVQEWIEGCSLKFLSEERWRDVDFMGFLDRVHMFSRNAPCAESDLTPAEIRVNAENYLRRSLGFIRWQGPKDQLVSAGRLYMDRQKIAKDIDLFNDLVLGVSLPAFSILGDPTHVNVMHQNPSKRLIIIDMENITHGVLSFDCAWLLTTVARRHCPENLLVEAYRYIASESFVVNDDEARLMRVLLKILLENDLRIIRSGLSRTHRLLKVVQEDLRCDGLLQSA